VSRPRLDRSSTSSIYTKTYHCDQIGVKPALNDNDVPDMPDRLEIKITAQDYAKLRELSKTSDITHCICCLAPASGGGDPGWGAAGFGNRLTGAEMRTPTARCFPRLWGRALRLWSAGIGTTTRRTTTSGIFAGLRGAPTLKTANVKHCVRNGSDNMTHRTHCARGHAYSPENTRIRKSGGRRCGTCVREDCRRNARNSYRLKEEVRRRNARRRAPFKEAV